MDFNIRKKNFVYHLSLMATVSALSIKTWSQPLSCTPTEWCHDQWLIHEALDPEYLPSYSQQTREFIAKQDGKKFRYYCHDIIRQDAISYWINQLKCQNSTQPTTDFPKFECVFKTPDRVVQEAQENGEYKNTCGVKKTKAEVTPEPLAPIPPKPAAQSKTCQQLSAELNELSQEPFFAHFADLCSQILNKTQLDEDSIKRKKLLEIDEPWCKDAFNLFIERLSPVLEQLATSDCSDSEKDLVPEMQEQKRKLEQALL